MRFGETADEFGQRRSEMSDDVWIKGFKDGATRVRFLQPTGQWITYREHYSEGPGFFPCSEDTTSCPGCTDPSEKVQKRNRRYAMNCLGESGRVDVHKVGSRLYKTLKSREQRLETIMDRDYTIVRSGKGLDTVYDIENGEKYPIDDSEVELHDIPAILEAKYAEACEAYGIEPPEDGEDSDPDIEAAARSALAKETPAEEPAENNTPEDKLKALHEGRLSPKDEAVTTDDLRKFLADKGVEAPPRAPRGRLETIVSNWITNNPPF